MGDSGGDRHTDPGKERLATGRAGRVLRAGSCFEGYVGKFYWHGSVAYCPVSSADPTPEKFEAAIVAVSPLLDLVLSVGERISRVAEPVDYEYYPVPDEELESSRG